MLQGPKLPETETVVKTQFASDRMITGYLYMQLVRDG